MPNQNTSLAPFNVMPGGRGYVSPLQSQTANYTVPREESGCIYLAGAADLTYSLPAPELGLHYRFLAQVIAGQSVGLTVHPTASAKMIGNAFTAAAGKGAVNTHGTEVIGDMLSVISDGTDWYIVGVKGTWAREA